LKKKEIAVLFTKWMQTEQGKSKKSGIFSRKNLLFRKNAFLKKGVR
jgi:hypothetical protein